MSDKFINQSGLSALRAWILGKLGQKQDKVSNPGAGNILVTDTNGQAQDSGIGMTDKQDTLESGVNIKTINSQSVLGYGDLEITIPTHVSELTNDSGFQSRSDVETLIQDELARFDKLDYEIVTTLPATGLTGVRYLVKHASDDRYEEYIYVNDAWYDIGATDEVNLDDYYTKIETDTLLDGKEDILTFDTEPTAGSTNPVTSDGIKSYVDGRDPFMLLDFSQAVSITLPSVTADVANTSIPNVDVSISAEMGESWAIAGLVKYEVYNGSTRLNVMPICSFSMNTQKTLRLRMMVAGPSSKPMTKIQGAILLKHR